MSPQSCSSIELAPPTLHWMDLLILGYGGRSSETWNFWHWAAPERAHIRPYRPSTEPPVFNYMKHASDKRQRLGRNSVEFQFFFVFHTNTLRETFGHGYHFMILLLFLFSCKTRLDTVVDSFQKSRRTAMEDERWSGRRIRCSGRNTASAINTNYDTFHYLPYGLSVTQFGDQAEEW